MGSRYRKIDTRIWNDEKFRALPDRGKLVFFMLLTHPNMTALGAMRGNLPGLAAEMGWGAEAFREAFREVSAKGMAEHDERACLIALPRFLRYNPPESPNVVKAWIGAIDLLPECAMKSLVLQRAQAFAEGMTEGFQKAFRQAFPKGMPIQEQEQEQEQEQDQKKKPSSPARAGGSRFEEFWAVYPRHDERKTAREKWVGKALDQHADEIIADVIARKATHGQWQDPKFIPYAQKYLTREIWKDPINTRRMSANAPDPAGGKLTQVARQLFEASHDDHPNAPGNSDFIEHEQ